LGALKGGFKQTCRGDDGNGNGSMTHSLTKRQIK